MAKSGQRNIVSLLADAGEEAIQKIGTAPGGDRIVGAVNALRERVDDMQKNMRAIASIEKRLDTIERRLDKLEGKPTSTASRSTPRKSSSGSQKKTTT
jgi:hypothetical protein